MQKGFAVLAVVASVMWPPLVFAASESYEFEQMFLSSATAQRFTVNKTTGTDFGTPGCVALVTAEAAYRFRIDGTTPTATTGHLVASGQPLLVDGNRDIRAFKAIANGGVDRSTMSVTFGKGCK